MQTDAALKGRFFLGAPGTALRYDLSQDLSVMPEEVDRVALSIGIALVNSQRHDHPLSLLAETRGLRIKPDQTGSEQRGVEISMESLLKPGMMESFSDACRFHSIERSAEIGFLLNSGYGFLAELHDSMEKDTLRMFRLIAEYVSQSLPQSGEPLAEQDYSGPITLLLGKKTESGEEVGWVLNREEGQDTAANLRIAGSQGKGKSQALLGLLYSLTSSTENTGFILLDYKGDLSEGATGEAFRSSTGAKLIRPPESPIPLNPFDLPGNSNIELAAEVFSSTLASIIPQMGGCQQGIVDRALAQAYRDARLAGHPGPSLMEARDAVRAIYEGERRKDDTVVLALDRLAGKPIFTSRSEIDVVNVFRQRWVVDLSKLGELKTYVAFILMHFLRQIAESIPDSPFDRRTHTRTIRGVVAIDEAHHYLQTGRKSQPLAQLVRIGRSKGVPVFLSSQSLDDFKGDTAWRELVPNNILFAHGAPPDVDSLQSALRVDARTAKNLASSCLKLDQFVAYSHHSVDGSGKPAPVRITPFFERSSIR